MKKILFLLLAILIFSFTIIGQEQNDYDEIVTIDEIIQTTDFLSRFDLGLMIYYYRTIPYRYGEEDIGVYDSSFLVINFNCLFNISENSELFFDINLGDGGKIEFFSNYTDISISNMIFNNAYYNVSNIFNLPIKFTVGYDSLNFSYDNRFDNKFFNSGELPIYYKTAYSALGIDLFYLKLDLYNFNFKENFFTNVTIQPFNFFKLGIQTGYLGEADELANKFFTSLQLKLKVNNFNFWFYEGISFYAFADLSNQYNLQESSYGVKINLGTKNHSIGLVYNSFKPTININPYVQFVKYDIMSRFGIEIITIIEFSEETKLEWLTFFGFAKDNGRSKPLNVSSQLKYNFNKNIFVKLMIIDNIFAGDPFIFDKKNLNGIYFMTGFEI